ncbi:MAG: class I SAM-dependent methyltransferase, partial [Bacteroidota bacterium]
MDESVKPYNETDSKKEQVSTMFNRIAPYYDFLNRLLTLGIDESWRRKAIQQLDRSKDKLILDVATGTADVALATAKKINPDRVIGIDISTEMLDICRSKIKKQGLNT